MMLKQHRGRHHQQHHHHVYHHLILSLFAYLLLLSSCDSSVISNQPLSSSTFPVVPSSSLSSSPGGEVSALVDEKYTILITKSLEEEKSGETVTTPTKTARRLQEVDDTKLEDHEDDDGGHDGEGEGEKEGDSHHIEPAEYILFPFFVQIVGIVVFYITTYALEHVIALPYTAIMFLIGTTMGIGAELTHNDDSLTKSIWGWANIDSELLFLSFLPGLLFWDSLNTSRYLFYKGLPQILLLAFPAVLMGTVLTALVVYYIFPYGWSFNLAMTIGSILSATDPVAVAALLSEVGAPPRLQILISGESMFNDGSAIVFFTIFSERFFYELNIEHFGEDINLKDGISIFFRMAGGGAAIGIAFGLTLIWILGLLNRRLSSETNIVEIITTLSIAYITFYVSEIVCGCSGVIAVVCCGIFTNAFGSGYLNDPVLLKNFWSTLEHLLNTLLFCLGGVVWGRVLVDSDVEDLFSGRDWGYLILLFIMLTLIRFLLVGICYPILSNVGLKTNWQESVFLSYGGLRGAVGIALAIAIDNDVRRETNDPFVLSKTNKVFGFVGGIAFLTLIINGSSAGPLLIKLGLAKSTETRKRVLEHYELSLAQAILSEYAEMITKPLFRCARLELVAHHIPFFDYFTKEQIQEAIDTQRKHEEGGEGTEGNKHDLPATRESTCFESHTFDHLNDIDVTNGDQQEEEAKGGDGVEVSKSPLSRPSVASRRTRQSSMKQLVETMNIDEQTKELRLMFLELLNAGYEKQRKNGYLNAREDDGFVYFVLKLSLELAQDSVNRGGPLKDWENVEGFVKNTNKLDTFIETLINPSKKKAAMMSDGDSGASPEYQRARVNIHRSISFLYAHTWSRQRLESEFIRGNSELKDAAQQVCKESHEECEKAERLYQGTEANGITEEDRATIIAHYVSAVLLNKMAKIIERSSTDGLLSEKEAQEYLELIEKDLEMVHVCLESHTEE